MHYRQIKKSIALTKSINGEAIKTIKIKREPISLKTVFLSNIPPPHLMTDTLIFYIYYT